MHLTKEEIESRALYHPPSKEAVSRHQEIRSLYEGAAKLTNMLPDGRETSLAQTKLEEWMFWANAAIARNHDKL